MSRDGNSSLEVRQKHGTATRAVPVQLMNAGSSMFAQSVELRDISELHAKNDLIELRFTPLVEGGSLILATWKELRSSMVNRYGTRR